MFSKLNLKVKPILSLFALTAALGVFSSQASAMVVLDVRDGVLYGASGVEVSGSFYNVEFVDGTFDSVFPSSPSFFTNYFGAVAASIALLDQVFVDGPLGNFGYNLSTRDSPSYVNGCIGSPICDVQTPIRVQGNLFSGYVTDTQTARLNNTYETNIQLSKSYQFNLGTGRDDVVWSRWSRMAQVSPVPEPSTYAMMGLGLLGVMWMSRRRQEEV